MGRSATTQEARRQIADHNNLGLNDPRRMGKTVWLDLFCADPGDGLDAIKIDYEGVPTCDEFLLRTVEGLRSYRSLPDRAGARLRALFDGIDELKGGPVSVKKGVSTRAATDLLVDAIRSVDDHLESGQTLVIAMDEVPVAVLNIIGNEGPEAANRLLQTLRSVRRRESNLRWIVCGSIGFHHVLRLCGATEGVLNDLINLPLGPLADDEATELAKRLLLGIGRGDDEAAIAAMCEDGGRIPFLIHALAHRLEDAESDAASEQDVRQAFQDLLDDRDDSRAVTHLVTRLEPYYGDRTAIAQAILDRVGVDGNAPAGDFDGNVLDDLLDDHYLVEHRGSVGWRYDVLRRIWKHRRRLS